MTDVSGMGNPIPRGPQPEVVQLSPAEHAGLRRIARSAEPSRVVRRALAILALNRGERVEHVARFLATTRQTVTNWRTAWQANPDRSTSLFDREHPGRPPEWTEERQALLEGLLDRLPEQFGYRARSWTAQLLMHTIDQLSGWQPSERSIRMELKNLGYVYKRPRYELEPDPQFAKKSGTFDRNSALLRHVPLPSSRTKPTSCSSRR
jgi:transposase